MRGPNVTRARLNVSRARKAWGDDLPDWVAVLAESCDATGASQSSLGARIGYSAAVVNTVMANAYKGDLSRVQIAVEGALMAVEVDCPVLGSIPSNKCLSEQKRKLDGANPTRIKLWRACRNKCPHSRLGDAHA